METFDFNGTGRWSYEAVQERYAAYARRLRVSPLLQLEPLRHEERDRCWIYPVMDEVIKGIEQGDKACIQIGVEFIEEDAGFRFGRILKSNTARALRRCELDSQQIERIRKRVVVMLIDENMVREYREYSKLLRKVGLGDWWPHIEAKANFHNPYVLRYYNYFLRHLLPEQPKPASERERNI